MLEFHLRRVDRHGPLADALCVLAVGAVAIWLLSCSATPPPGPPPEPPQDGPATCEAACDRRAALKCEGGPATAEGTPCAVVCLNVMTSGIITWDLACMTSAETCDAFDACNE